MSNGVNKVILIGNLGSDPDIRQTRDGKPIANMRIATTESWRDRSTGERKERTQWHNIVVFSEGLVRIIERHVRKGSRIYVEGQLQTRKWEDQNNVERYTTEVVLQGFGGTLIMLDGRGDQRSGGDSYSSFDSGRDSTGVGNDGGGGTARDLSSDLDDDIPF